MAELWVRPSASAMLDWLDKMTQKRKVYLEGYGWIRLTRDEISDAMRDAEKGSLSPRPEESAHEPH